MAANSPVEKRSFPRARTRLKITDTQAPENRLTLLDCSERGLRFDSDQAMRNPAASLKISFPDQTSDLSTRARFVWKEPLKKGGVRYGAQFMELRPQAVAYLRRAIIQAHIEDLLNQIPDKENREAVTHFFLTDVAQYISNVLDVQQEADQNNGHSRPLQNTLEHLNTTVLLKGYSLGLLLSNQPAMSAVKKQFRSLLGTWVYQSAVMKRAHEKPRAYPNDYRMLEMIYQNCPCSQKLGAYFDLYFLNNPDAIALRSRKGRLREMLHQFINQHMEKPSLRILNVACGSCREIAELVSEIEYQNTLTLTCMDWDEEALAFSRTQLGNVPVHIKIDYVNRNLMDALKDNATARQLGEQDLIYTIGLADYLPDDLLQKCLRLFDRLLPIGGKIILTHKNPEKTFPPIPAEWFCDWESIPRAKWQLTDLFHKTLPGFTLDVTTDEFGYIYYFTLTKNTNTAAHPAHGAENKEKNHSTFKVRKIFV